MKEAIAIGPKAARRSLYCKDSREEEVNTCASAVLGMNSHATSVMVCTGDRVASKLASIPRQQQQTCLSTCLLVFMAPTSMESSPDIVIGNNDESSSMGHGSGKIDSLQCLRFCGT